MLSQLVDTFRNCSDFAQRTFGDGNLHVAYLSSMVGNDELVRDILHPFSDLHETEIPKILSQAPYALTGTFDECVQGILEGNAVLIYKNKNYLIDIGRQQGRSIQESNVEAVMSGPHDGFVENLSQNLSLIRNRIKNAQLKTVKYKIGTVTQTDIVIVYLDDMVDKDILGELMHKLESLEVSAIYSSSMLAQHLEESPKSIFPQYIVTERPDSACSYITQGRIVCLVDGSPSVFSLPTSFFEFFSSAEDYYQRWLVGSGLRLFRFLGLFISLIVTPLYVALTTYHYEIIPFNILLNLTESRRKVPFPPIIEALMMEVTIEMLKEAGARMPTKIGQTIGIVGGIVIGQAAVQAGITSNILIIAVAVSAITSFVIPNFIMSTSIRFVRFAVLILAGFWGMYGLVIGIGFIIIHLSSITNMGKPFLSPVAPIRLRDWLDTVIRKPSHPARSNSSNGKDNRK